MQENKNETEPLGAAQKNTHKSGVSSNKNIEKLLEQNFKINSEILEMVKVVKRYVIWQRVWGVLKLLIILIPIILSIIYLPPFIKGVYGQYKDFLQGTGVLGEFGDKMPEDIDMRSISEILKTGDISQEDISGKDMGSLIENLSEEEKQRALEYLKNKQ